MVQIKVNIRQTDGSFKRMSFYGKDKKEAEAKADKRKLEAEETYKRLLNPSFAEVADEWNELHENEIEHYTYQSYQAPLKDLKAEFGEYRLGEILPIEIQRFYQTMANQGYAKQTIKLRQTVLRQILDFAIVEKGLLQFNPSLSVKIPKGASKGIREPASDEDIFRVVKNVDSAFGLYAYLLYYTGCRREEALALRYDDIDFQNNLIYVKKVVVFENDKPILRMYTKSVDGMRAIPLLTPLRNVLYERVGCKGYIFTNKNGELMRLSEFSRAYNNYRRATGITATSHQFRHSFATLCFEAGLADKDAAEILGHSKVELTKNIYTHIRKSRKNLILSFLIIRWLSRTKVGQNARIFA